MRIGSIFSMTIALAGLAISTPLYAKTDIAITFDDLPAHGPMPEGMTRIALTKKIIATLKRHHISSVYGFTNTDRVEKVPERQEILNEWIRSGNLLGNHTHRHANLATLSAEAYRYEIDLADRALHQVSGGTDYKWFRYPFLIEGETAEKRNAVRQHLFKNGYKIAEVTIDFQDHSWNPAYVRCTQKRDVQSIRLLGRSYLEAARARFHHALNMASGLGADGMRHILLLHVSAFDSEMLDALLTLYENLGAHFVSLPYAGQDPIYRIDPKLLYNRGSTFLDQLNAAFRKSYPKVAPLPLEELTKICK